MSITPLELYWITRLDGIFVLLVSIGTVLTVACIIGFFACLECNNKNGMKFCKRGLIAGILSFVLSVFIPTNEEMAAIIVVPMVVNNEKVQEIASGSLDGLSNLVKLSNSWIEENLKGKGKLK